VSALGVGGRAAGANAHVLLVVVGARDDGSQVELVIRGELNLTPGSRSWKVFGFDLQRTVGAPGTYAASARRAREREQRQERKQRQAREQRRDPGQRLGGRS
jgi:6-phosphofructokinase